MKRVSIAGKQVPVPAAAVHDHLILVIRRVTAADAIGALKRTRQSKLVGVEVSG